MGDVNNDETPGVASLPPAADDTGRGRYARIYAVDAREVKASRAVKGVMADEEMRGR